MQINYRSHINLQDAAFRLESTRRIKPGVPLLGCAGIPLHEEINLEMFL